MDIQTICKQQNVSCRLTWVNMFVRELDYITVLGYTENLQTTKCFVQTDIGRYVLSGNLTI